MNCNCISTMEKEVAEQMKPEAGDDVKASCAVAGMTFGKKLSLTVNIPFRVKGTKKGYTSERGKEIFLIAPYCPFCGVSTSKNSAPEAEKALPALAEKTN